MKKHNYTPYDAGQDLIKCADALSEAEDDLRQGGYEDFSKLIRQCRLMIGKAFNQHGSHKFGLPESEGRRISSTKKVKS